MPRIRLDCLPSSSECSSFLGFGESGLVSMPDCVGRLAWVPGCGSGAAGVASGCWARALPAASPASKTIEKSKVLRIKKPPGYSAVSQNLTLDPHSSVAPKVKFSLQLDSRMPSLDAYFLKATSSSAANKNRIFL